MRVVFELGFDQGLKIGFVETENPAGNGLMIAQAVPGVGQVRALLVQAERRQFRLMNGMTEKYLVIQRRFITHGIGRHGIDQPVEQPDQVDLQLPLQPRQGCQLDQQCVVQVEVIRGLFTAQGLQDGVQRLDRPGLHAPQADEAVQPVQ